MSVKSKDSKILHRCCIIDNGCSDAWLRWCLCKLHELLLGKQKAPETVTIPPRPSFPKKRKRLNSTTSSDNESNESEGTEHSHTDGWV